MVDLWRYVQYSVCDGRYQYWTFNKEVNRWSLARWYLGFDGRAMRMKLLKVAGESCSSFVVRHSSLVVHRLHPIVHRSHLIFHLSSFIAHLSSLITHLYIIAYECGCMHRSLSGCLSSSSSSVCRETQSWMPWVAYLRANTGSDWRTYTKEWSYLLAPTACMDDNDEWASRRQYRSWG